ncbi:MAG TPA: tetratricopeptide repeat protein [Leptospiraceae bacterium]|nr:tetratricopeptide repeat protein [Leptospiraceae bacterium]HNA09358.1 tetratricopeptide repeat protein [Leptospiraceae bacterium]HNE08950.1 tetratricopeptide repeat protein [Leptospiraceae bacterium]HNE51804.1 tetratricopeptide repeat protein [Leptospiraceae bacterium]HNH02218.1 tetratricopeptide repeat protein [Leptospiraceae bacterium]
MYVRFLFFLVLLVLLTCNTPEQKTFKPVVESAKIKGRIQIAEIKYTGPPAQSWIVSGIRDTVTNDLAKIKEVSAISIEDQREAFKMIAFKQKTGVNIDASIEAAKILAADYLCVGNLQNTGKTLRLNIRLLKSPDFSAEQSTTIDGTLDEIFTLQDKVVESLLVNVDAKMSHEERLVIEVFTPKNKNAYELYSQGIEIQDTNPKKALDLFLQALKLEPDYLDAMNRVGQQYGTFGNFSEALNYHEKRRKILEEKGLSKHEGYSTTLNNIGTVYISQDNYDLALEYLFKSKKIEEDLGHTKTDDYANILSNIGLVYNNKGNYDLALEYYTKSKKIKEDLGLTKTESYAIILSNIGLAYSDQRNFDLALEHYSKSKTIREEHGLTKTNGYANILDNIGVIYYNQLGYCESVEWLKKAVEIREKIGVPSNRKNLEIAQKKCNESKRR